MANYNALKSAVADVVKTNGNQGITGANLQSTLFDIIDTLGAGYTYAGVASPDTSPGSPDTNVFYIAPPGVYDNFGATYTVPNGCFGLFRYNGNWGFNAINVGISSRTYINSAYLNSHPEIDSVFDLGRNKVYSIASNVTSSMLGGLPVYESDGTLFIYNPDFDSRNGYSVMIYAVRGADNKPDMYFAFTYHNDTSSTLVWQNYNEDILLEANVGLINSTYLANNPSIDTFLKLKPNRLYMFDNSVPASFGLPVQNYGTLEVFVPKPSSNTSTGWRVYRFTAGSASIAPQSYWAFTLDGASVGDVIWNRIPKDSESISSPGTVLNTTYLANNPTIDSFLKLPKNKIYQVYSGLPSSFGLPVDKYGTLLVYSPFGGDTSQIGYAVYEYIVISGSSGDTSMRWWCFGLNNSTVGNTVWHRIDNAEVVNWKLRKLGLAATKVAFVGDSITAGYGTSDFNGGESGTSGHQIPNNVGTYYRNTGTKCWANMLISYLNTKYDNVTAVNNGIGGFTTKQIYENIATLAVDDNNNIVDVVILMTGTNDTWNSNKVGAVTYYIGLISQWCARNGVELVVITNTPQKTGTPPNDDTTVQSAILLACQERGLTCVNMLSNIYYYIDTQNISLNSIMYDNLHPNDSGHEIIYKLVKKGMQL